MLREHCPDEGGDEAADVADVILAALPYHPAIRLVQTWNLCRVAHERAEHCGDFSQCANGTCRAARSTLEETLMRWPECGDD
jgi:hypothetical protein